MRNLFKSIFLYLSGLVFGLIILEAFYQVVEIELPYHELSPTVGKKMLPSRRITYFGDGFYLGETNKFGYLGKSYPPEKEKGKIRIALIGDSYTEGFQMFEQHHFSQILENKLNNGQEIPRYEILNFGMGNFNYNDMVILYKNFIESFNCDVLMFILSEYDFVFRNNFVPSPILKLNEDSLYIDYSFTQSKVYKYYNFLSFFSENSCLFKALLNAYKLTQRDVINEIVLGKFYQAKEKSKGTIENPALTPVKIEDERIIKSLDWFHDKRTYFIFKLDISPENKVILSEHDITYLPLKPIFDERLTKKGVNYKYWDVTRTEGHWTFPAQIVVGEVLYDLIKQDEN